MEASGGHRAHRIGRLYWRARHEGSVDPDHSLDAVARHQGGIPCDRAAPIVTDDHALADSESVEHPDDIANQLALRVRLDWRGTFGLAVSALVGRNRVKARLRERLHLMAPRVPHLGKAMAQDDRKALAGLCDVHPDAIAFHETMLDLAHR